MRRLQLLRGAGQHVPSKLLPQRGEPCLAARADAKEPAAQTAMVTVQPADQEIPATLPGGSPASVRAILRQDLWQEPYAVVLQVRIRAGGVR